jgi:hypothetical protein
MPTADIFSDDEENTTVYIDNKLILQDKDLSSHSIVEILSALGYQVHYHGWDREKWSEETQDMLFSGTLWTQHMGDLPAEVLLTPVG